MRSDALRNRGLIVATASALLTRRGAAVSMEEIARAAGLGVGTLYRHFPDRQTLLEDIAADAVRQLLAAGRTEQAQGLTGWQLLLQLVERCAGLPLALIKELAGGRPPRDDLRELTQELNALLEQIAARAQREGSLRADVPPAEVVGLLNVMLCRPGARADDYLTTVLLDGLRSGAGHPPPS
ncbi:helix-turn-helix transcriptional regulator [Frankia sp. CNm7]|uniref:Helix-turn-helix transcriptional regulator n=1 Tax=Frankia nepalensis TaxID=1836974 RepID=A0A937RJP0_9ACTN|nr:TetR/AcrR family transcriptional regulator [Frankia nepalensis]MBL7500638.1 helix-turn-helix transcriptional regulator [Frankia nepalensis]MBL7511401.1 helix-turn-helix transcriptional regulator [Frankia nepalensis]MBL7521766.1 helix-turn-helix transcriptional regulator [Frankia nepalensis]MBL7631497.1 helix-turn-helix transcriptional regulator [Frankia nepalensis]